MSTLLSLLLQLMACPSITPQDANCQPIIAARLAKQGFKVESIQIGQVSNLWARIGESGPLLVFAGHTDVVPPGPEKNWRFPPFKPTVKDGVLYGRGASDMKGAIAAMLIAVENFLATHKNFKGSIAFLLTSDEEGPAIDGTEKVIKLLQKRGVKIDYALVGEASSEHEIGDQIRIGRRGSLHGTLIVQGKQGHVAYPQAVINPIQRSLVALNTLSETVWDQGNADFPPTSFQLTYAQAGTGARNVVPGELDVYFNFRYSPAVSVAELKKRSKAILDTMKLPYELTWTIGAEPFLSKPGRLLQATQQAIHKVTGLKPTLSTAGGTSDARFIAPTGAEVLELGVQNATAHQVNEHVRVADVEKLGQIYQQILEELL
jgi:succinyl-diaminopimelate desuccinylase